MQAFVRVVMNKRADRVNRWENPQRC